MATAVFSDVPEQFDASSASAPMSADECDALRVRRGVSDRLYSFVRGAVAARAERARMAEAGYVDDENDGALRMFLLAELLPLLPDASELSGATAELAGGDDCADAWLLYADGDSNSSGVDSELAALRARLDDDNAATTTTTTAATTTATTMATTPTPTLPTLPHQVGGRVCGSCHRSLRNAEFTKSQLKNGAKAKCKQCASTLAPATAAAAAPTAPASAAPSATPSSTPARSLPSDVVACRFALLDARTKHVHASVEPEFNGALSLKVFWRERVLSIDRWHVEANATATSSTAALSDELASFAGAPVSSLRVPFDDVTKLATATHRLHGHEFTSVQMLVSRPPAAFVRSSIAQPSAVSATPSLRRADDKRVSRDWCDDKQQQLRVAAADDATDDATLLHLVFDTRLLHAKAARTPTRNHRVLDALCDALAANDAREHLKPGALVCALHLPEEAAHDGRFTPDMLAANAGGATAAGGDGDGDDVQAMSKEDREKERQRRRRQAQRERRKQEAEEYVDVGSDDDELDDDEEIDENLMARAEAITKLLQQSCKRTGMKMEDGIKMFTAKARGGAFAATDVDNDSDDSDDDDDDGDSDDDELTRNDRVCGRRRVGLTGGRGAIAETRSYRAAVRLGKRLMPHLFERHPAADDDFEDDEDDEDE